MENGSISRTLPTSSAGEGKGGSGASGVQDGGGSGGADATPTSSDGNLGSTTGTGAQATYTGGAARVLGVHRKDGWRSVEFGALVVAMVMNMVIL